MPRRTRQPLRLVTATAGEAGEAGSPKAPDPIPRKTMHGVFEAGDAPGGMVWLICRTSDGVWVDVRRSTVTLGAIYDADVEALRAVLHAIEPEPRDVPQLELC